MKQNRRSFLSMLAAVVMADLEQLWQKLFPRPKKTLNNGWTVKIKTGLTPSTEKEYLFAKPQFVGTTFTIIRGVVYKNGTTILYEPVEVRTQMAVYEYPAIPPLTSKDHTLETTLDKG